jgi:ParB/RepB/Spo0J family partition protein
MTASPPTPETIVNLRLAEVHPAVDNVRADVGDVTELAASIAEVGVLEPLIVVPATGNGGGYMIVVGHRRLAGAKLAGVPHVPAIIRQLDERQRVEAMLIENLQRQDLEPLEESRAYRRLVELGLGQAAIASKIGRSQAHVSKRLALLKLPANAQTALAAGALRLEDAADLIAFDGEVVDRVLKYAGEVRDRQLYPGQIKRLAETAKQELHEELARKTALEGLTAAKVSILKTDQYGHPAGHVYRLGKGWHEIPMTAAAHKKEPCHAAYVTGRGEVVYVCTKPENHLKAEAKPVAKAAREIAGVKKGADGKLAKAAQVKAAETRERNKALRIAEPIRRKLAVQLLKPSKVRREALDFAIRQLIQTVLDSKPELGRLAAELLDVKAKDRDGRPSFKTFVADPTNIDTLAYALGLAAGEQPFAQLVARSYFDEEYSSHAARYFAHLKAANYKATPTELAQIKTSGWRGPFDAK